jgi:hypothetical protein
MSDRRGFLKGLLAAGPVLVLEKGSPLPIMKRFTSAAPDKFEYRGFKVFWTGWKSAFNSDIEVAQWCAYNGNSKHDSVRCIYASYPGSQGLYFPGQIFDISIKEDQEVPTRKSSEEDKQRYRLQCLHRLMYLIDGWASNL